MLRRPFLGSTASMARPREAQRHRGHTRSPVENARALLHVALLQERHSLSFDAAIKTTAAGELASLSTLREAAEQFAASGALPEPDTSLRGCGNPDHSLNRSNTDRYGPSFEAELLIHRLVHSRKTEGTYVTSTVIRAELQQRLSVDVCRRTVRPPPQLKYSQPSSCDLNG